MNTITYTTSGVCAKNITLTIEGNIIKSLSFKNGCEGNLQGLSRLIEGMSIEEVVKRLRGIDCSGKGTSCPDQLAKALEQLLKSDNEGNKAV